MNYYKIRGRPDDPKNIAYRRQNKSLESLVKVDKLSKCKPSNPRVRLGTAPAMMHHHHHPNQTNDPFVVKKLTVDKSETIQDRIKTEIYQKIVPNVPEIPVNREEKTMQLIKEILNDSFVTKLEIERNDADVIKTIEETQKEINLAANQLIEINKLLEKKKSESSLGDENEEGSMKRRPKMTLKQLIKYNHRKGWEWMSSQYLENINDNFN